MTEGFHLGLDCAAGTGLLTAGMGVVETSREFPRGSVVKIHVAVSSKRCCKQTFNLGVKDLAGLEESK